MGDPSQTRAVSDVAPSTSIQQITGFVDDATQQPASLPSTVTPMKPIIADSMEARIHSIVDVLSRPVSVAIGTWAASDLEDAILQTLPFPQKIFDFSPNIVDKLNYFAFFRADVCIRVMVNANTFQAGKLIGYFTPFEEYTGDRILATDFPSSYTTYPYVINDSSVGNSTDLLIPYVAPYSSYRLTDKVGNIGTFYLRVLNRLRSGDCSYTVYAWFTNISLSLPTGNENALTESGLALRSFKRALATGINPLRVTDYRAQVAGEAEQKSSGIVSGTLHTVADIGTALESVPLLAPVAAPVSWVSRALAGVAEYFGWSKPLDLSNNQKFAQLPAYGFTHGTGLDSGVVLATTQDNSIESRGDLFGSNVDEMEISWIVAHKCLVDRFSMNTDQIPGEKLFSFPVTPGWCTYSGAEYKPTITAFVASMFQYWRGGLKYKIQAAKTAYHSGRLRIVYSPANFSDVIDFPDQAYNWILDLRTSSELEFEIPYNNILEWQRCGLTDSLVSNYTLGTVRIEVLNELRAPTSVSATIDFNVWISGAADLQFAVPEMSRYVPSLVPETFQAQVLGSAQDTGFNDMSEKPCMFQMEPASRIDVCKVTTGEFVRNLRVLTRRFGLAAREAATDTIIKALPSYYFGLAYVPGSGVSNYRITPVDYISWIYKFFRGGVRWKAMFNGLITIGGQQQACYAFNAPERTIEDVTELSFENSFDAAGSFQHRTFTSFNPVLEVTAPYYSQVPIRPVQSATGVVLPFLDNAVVYYKFTAPTPSGSVDILKAASDDFSFGWLVGPPYLVPRTDVLALDWNNAQLVQYDEPNYNIIFGGGSTTFRPGNYRVLAQTSSPTIPIVFDIAAVPTQSDIPANTFTLLIGEDYSLNFFTTFPTPTGGTFNEAETLSAVQMLGGQGLDLEAF